MDISLMSRDEKLLRRLLGESIEIEDPQSRIEFLLKQIIDAGGIGGGSYKIRDQFVSPIWVENQSNSYKIKLQYSDDKSEWNDASELITFYIPTVATGKFDVYIPSNEEDSHRYWRLNFTEPSSTSLSAVVSGCAFMGDE